MRVNSLGKRSGPSKDLLTAAKGGSAEAIGRMLQSCRTYLMLIAQEELDERLRAKIGASDLVQETFVAAQQAFDRFHGESSEALMAWLRGILIHKISEVRRHYVNTERRAVAREVPLDGGPASAPLARAKPVKTDTPSRQMAATEEAERISLALSSLSPDHQRVIQMRNWKRLAFEEIGRRMNRSGGAARALWIRAIEQLTSALGPRDE
jgi:RNA polymerase sigma-70 factor, ECF subfamily